MGDKYEAFGQIAVAKPKAAENAYVLIDKNRFVQMVSANCFFSEAGTIRKPELDAQTIGFLGVLSEKARVRGEMPELPRELFEKLSLVEENVNRAVAAMRPFVGNDVIERTSTRAVETLVGIGFKKEEASYLVGKALIDMGLGEPLQKMLSFSGTNVDLINAFMTKMRVIAHAKEQKEKSERDLKNVLAEHNVTEHKYEAA